MRTRGLEPPRAVRAHQGLSLARLPFRHVRGFEKSLANAREITSARDRQRF
jgi:hypothetical protein